MSASTKTLICAYAAIMVLVGIAAFFPGTLSAHPWNAPPPPNRADVNGDGFVTFADVTAILTAMNGAPAPPAQPDADLVASLRTSLETAFNFDGGNGVLVYAVFRLPGGAEGLCDRLGRREAFKGPTSDGKFPPFSSSPAQEPEE